MTGLKRFKGETFPMLFIIKLGESCFMPSPN